MKAIFFTMAYNVEHTIARTIYSIQSQTCTDWEYYVLDNGSTDCTGDIIKKYASSDSRIKHVSIRQNDPGNGGVISFGAMRTIHIHQIFFQKCLPLQKKTAWISPRAVMNLFMELQKRF